MASQRAKEWAEVAAEVEQHIETYTVPQYGDKGNDQVTGYTPAECMKQVGRYHARFGRNARPGQDELDLIKIMHYAQMTLTKMREARQ